MQRFTEETKKKVVRQHIQDGRTITSLAAEFGASHATILNWIKNYRQEKAELEKENTFLKKAAAFFAKEIH